jgi:hypothetical protein
MGTRRDVLSILMLGAAATGLSGCADGDRPDPVAAWRDPGAGEKDPRRYALAHAILAPNPHNMQPWLVELRGADEIVLSLDPSRLLPETDPFGRQIVIGCGAFLELLDQSARQSGHRAEVTLWPEGEPQPTLDTRPFAHVRLMTDAAASRDALFAHILTRRTNREVYEPRTPSVDDLNHVINDAALAEGLSAGFAIDAAQVRGLRDIVWRGWLREFETPAKNYESVKVMRVGKSEIAKHRDGISIDFPGIEILKALGQMTPEKLADVNSIASKEGAKMWQAMATSAPAFLWLASSDNSRVTQINAGRAYVRLNLAAAARGLSMHPWSMALQEYPEMAKLYAEQQAMLSASAAAPVQMLVRIGYAAMIDPSPRRGLGEHLKT